MVLGGGLRRAASKVDCCGLLWIWGVISWCRCSLGPADYAWLQAGVDALVSAGYCHQANDGGKGGLGALASVPGPANLVRSLTAGPEIFRFVGILGVLYAAICFAVLLLAQTVRRKSRTN
jgi:hypothetical protein